jgi:hypothetical protein
MRNFSTKAVQENHHAVYETMCKIMVEPDKPHMTYDKLQALGVVDNLWLQTHT